MSFHCYHTFAGATIEAIKHIAQAQVVNSRGDTINLYCKDGSPNIDACMSLLGFDMRYGVSIVLRVEKEIQNRVPLVSIRNRLRPSELQETTVYSGKLKEYYTPPEEIEHLLSEIYFDENIMHTVAEELLSVSMEDIVFEEDMQGGV